MTLNPHELAVLLEAARATPSESTAAHLVALLFACRGLPASVDSETLRDLLGFLLAEGILPRFATPKASIVDLHFQLTPQSSTGGTSY